MSNRCQTLVAAVVTVVTLAAGGLRRATLHQYSARFNTDVAAYRETVPGCAVDSGAGWWLGHGSAALGRYGNLSEGGP